MRVLLDENLPVDFASLVTWHVVETVSGLGWSGVKNGELLERMEGRFDALLTMDRNLPHQRNVAALPFGIVVIQARSNRMVHLRPLVPQVLSALEGLRAGELRRVPAGLEPRAR